MKRWPLPTPPTRTPSVTLEATPTNFKMKDLCFLPRCAVELIQLRRFRLYVFEIKLATLHFPLQSSDLCRSSSFSSRSRSSCDRSKVITACLSLVMSCKPKVSSAFFNSFTFS